MARSQASLAHAGATPHVAGSRRCSLTADIVGRISTPLSLDWAYEGQQRVESAAAPLSDADVRAPSALPGWTRGHVLTHLARNADALVNLLTWARTGEPRPMYASAEQRNADIEGGAGRPAEALRADLRAAAERFRDAAAALDESGWTARVQTRAGREIPATEVPWLRVREVWLHLVDLRVGATVDDIPDAIAWQLTTEVAATLSPSVGQAVELRVPGRGAVRLGPGEPGGQLAGSAQRIAGWLTGRCDTAGLQASGTIPTLPPWL